jgi:AmpD protein
LINLLRNQYPRIERDAIVGHSEIAPGRKTDPGPAFDWSRLEGSSANRVRNAE